MYANLRKATDKAQHQQVVDLIGKMQPQVPATNQMGATLRTALVGMIKTRQFEQALAFIKKNKMTDVQFEEAYILHRMADNKKALQMCSKLPAQDIKTQLLSAQINYKLANYREAVHLYASLVQ